MNVTLSLESSGQLCINESLYSESKGTKTHNGEKVNKNNDEKCSATETEGFILNVDYLSHRTKVNIIGD